MSDFFGTPTHPKAKKVHKCEACGWDIPKGEKYVQQEGFFDGSAFRNRFHNECYDELNEIGEGSPLEFVTGVIDPPERLLQLIKE